MGRILYVSYNIAAGAAMLAVMGGTTKDEKKAGLGGILGGIGMGVLIILINLGMLMNMDVILALHSLRQLFFHGSEENRSLKVPIQ